MLAKLVDFKENTQTFPPSSLNIRVDFDIRKNPVEETEMF